jgi:hypothetical protein
MGASTENAIAFETGTWVGPPIAYAYNRYKRRHQTTTPYPTTYAEPNPRPTTTRQNKNLTYYQMAPKGSYRTRNWTKKPAPKKKQNTVVAHRFFKPQRSLRDNYQMKTCKYTDVLTRQQSPTQLDIIERLVPSQIDICEGIKRNLNLFEYARIVSMKVEFMVDRPQLVLSTEELDDDSLHTTKAQFEKNATLRLHRCYPDHNKYSRSLNLTQIDSHRDFVKTSSFTTKMGTDEYKASINFGAFDLPTDLKMTIIRTFIVQFKDIREDTALDNATPSGQ